MFPFTKVSVVCWIVFWLYWLISAFWSKKNISPITDRFIGARLGFFVVAVVLFRLINVQNYSFENKPAFHNDFVQIAGFIMLLIGLLSAVWARVYLGKNWGMPMTQKQNLELVTSGPYRYVRHPIYTGILLAVVGSALSSGIYWLIFLIIMGPYFVYAAVVEERLMMKNIPKAYLAYKSKTKMLIPFVF